jgi:hypothetical protein
MKLAIIIGVSEYQHDNFDNLDACKKDAELFRDILSDVSSIDDFLFINNVAKAFEAKKQLSDFVSKHKKNTVDELVFYFSGHGGRYEDDFFYIFSDFKEEKKESTGLRNTELDRMVRSLKPKLFVKIVDACFSGTQYIKAESNTKIELEKSAKENQLDDIYFMFSSREDQVSFAGTNYSKFTESLFTCLLDHTGEIRYRDIAAYIADDFNSNGFSKPIFISQADLVEIFGVITENTHKLILNAFGLEEKLEETEPENPPKSKENELLDLVKRKAETEYCDEKTSIERLKLLTDRFNAQNWPEEIASIFEIDILSDVSPSQIPNSHRIGTWLNENRGKEFFAIPTHTKESYEVEEYKPLPKKPAKQNHLATALAISRMFSSTDDTEYKLEKVAKTRMIVDGFSYNFTNENNILKISFEPRHISVKPLIIFIVCIYSRTELSIQYSYEFIKFTNFNTRSHPKCENWKVKTFKMKNESNILSATNEIINEISSWMITEITKSLQS